MAFLAVCLLAASLTAATAVAPACAKSNVQAFNACMASCHAISCKGGASGSCKNRKLACFAACQKLIKTPGGSKKLRSYRSR